jgi:uncharacterized protein YbjT (DUF2867 family)
MTPNARTILLAGATGLVGRELLRGLLADPGVAQVHALGRKAPAESNPKLTFHSVDFASLPPLPHIDECYIALGTTIKVAGSQQAFRAVDFDAVVNTAKAAKAAGATRLGVVSAMGADTHSSLFYSRVKGEMETALSQMGFDTLVIARPSMLAGDRASIGQRVRGGEELALKVSRWLGAIIPANYRSIAAASVARALLAGVPSSSGKRVMPSGELRKH